MWHTHLRLTKVGRLLANTKATSLFFRLLILDLSICYLYWLVATIETRKHSSRMHTDRDPPDRDPLDRDTTDRDPLGQGTPWTETPLGRNMGPETETPRKNMGPGSQTGSDTTQ